MANRGAVRGTDVNVDTTDFMAGLAREMRRLEVRSEAGLRRLAIDVQNRARQLAPVDTGRLRSSIVHTPGRDSHGAFVDVGSNVVYAAFVEFGTSRGRAQPFLRPALAEAVRDGIKGV